MAQEDPQEVNYFFPQQLSAGAFLAMTFSN
jgi:hypothetical protein